MNPKLQWLRNKMSSLDLQGIIISNPVNIRYLTNIDAEGVLLLTRKENIYITDGRYIEYVHSTLTLYDEIIVYNITDVSRDDYENFFMFCENVGFEENYLTYSKYKEYIRKYKINNFVETENIIEKQRMIKDEEEIREMQKAAEITDDCFSYILTYIKPGMTEKQIADEIENYFRRRTDGLAFETIVASGIRGAMPHGTASAKKITKGEPVIIDFGSKEQYTSDYTRMIYAGNDSEVLKVIDVVRSALEKSIENIEEGKLCGDIDNIARQYIEEHGYGAYFNHSLGHGVGIDVHELPVLKPKGDILLEDNMIFTIEPGIYLPDKFGVRLEQTVLINNGKPEIISSALDKYVYDIIE